MLIKSENRIIAADGYKYSHPAQYPFGANNQYDYGEARSNKRFSKTLVNGLQGLMNVYWTTPISKLEIDKAEILAKLQDIDFDRTGWDIILNEYNGFLPVSIKAVKEGTLLPNGNAMFTIELSKPDDRIFWIVSWLEDFLMKVWYTCNIGTISFFTKKMLMEMASLTSEAPFVNYQYINFGDRGSSTPESAKVGSVSHLIMFNSTETTSALEYIIDNYNVDLTDANKITATIPASEHSSITSWGRAREFDFVHNMLEKYKHRALIACVGDSYDIYNFTDKVTSGSLKEKIESNDYPNFVIRPDSGCAVEVINRMLDIMERNNVAYTVNSKGYKVFTHYKILYGDGITMETMQDILSTMILRKYSTENFVFGSGGFLMQQHDRDSLALAIKCSSIEFNDGTSRDVFKDPITAPNKVSKKGRVVACIDENGEYTTCLESEIPVNSTNALHLMFVNGKLVNTETFFEIRERANNELLKELKA